MCSFKKQRPARGALKHISNIISHKSVTGMVPLEMLQNWRAIAPYDDMNNRAAWPSNIRPEIEDFVGCKFHFISLVNMYKAHCKYFAKIIWNFQQHSECIVSLVPYAFSCDIHVYPVKYFLNIIVFSSAVLQSISYNNKTINVINKISSSVVKHSLTPSPYQTTAEQIQTWCCKALALTALYCSSIEIN